MKGRIVLAEDDPRQSKIIRLYLEREGHAVYVAEDGMRAVEEVRRRDPDLLILDVMMPKLDGLDVCRIIRAESDLPILMLTARATEDDSVIGFDLGADDYVTKPYRARELMARVRALLRRRIGAEPEEALLEMGDLVIDRDRRSVTVGDRAVELTASEFDILTILVGSRGKVFTRFELLERTVGFENDSLERTVDVHVRNIRRKLGDDARSPRYIATVVGVGYRAPHDA